MASSNSVQIAFNKSELAYSETFISDHLEWLDGKLLDLRQYYPLTPARGPRGILRNTVVKLNTHRLTMRLKAEGLPVYAEYGVQGAKVFRACTRSGLDLFVHFHGFDAYRNSTLAKYLDSYRAMFAYARGIIVVSDAMLDKLVGMGAPRSRLHKVVYGVDVERFARASPADNPPVLFACGRFVDKKAPQTTIMAFARIASAVPDAVLRMAGEGPLLGPCKALAKRLGLQKRVIFLGALEHDVVALEMKRSRAFVQHSVTALDGDAEGTPVAILEASCSGLPVIATRHAGIVEVIDDGSTGILVDERDVEAMADAMRTVIESASMAGELGARGRELTAQRFAKDKVRDALRSIVFDA